MRFFITILTLAAALTWTTTSKADPAGSIACSPLPSGASAGYRPRLDTGGHGFCVVTACQSPLELSGTHCVSPPSAKWFSADRSIQSGDYTLAVYAQLNRPPSGPQVYDLSTASSTATSSDFELLTTQAVFDNYSYSNPIFLKIKRTAGDQPIRTIALKLSNAAIGNGSISSPDTLTFTISAQSAQPIQLSAGDASVTAGGVAHIAVTLSEPHSIYFPTFITARYYSGDRSAVLVGQIDGSIPAGQTSAILNVPTTDRSIPANVTVQLSMRTAADILITKSLSLITVLSKTPTCSVGMHADGYSCVSDAYVATLGAYSPAPGAVSAVCAGSETATRSILSCLDSNTNQSVLNAFCMDPAPSITRLSPAGQQVCNVLHGSGFQSCSEGSSVPTACLATSCDEIYHLEGSVCVVNSYVPTYSSYSPASNPLTACQGTSSATRSLVGCKQNWDNADVDLSFCAGMDQESSITYQSPAGSQSCSIGNGIGTQSCSLGSTSPSACVAASCSTNFHISGGSCVADTYTATFSAYAANSVTAVCSGAQTASRSITACTRDNDGATMSLALCSDPSPTTAYQSPGGSQACSIANGAGSQTCSVGGTSWSTCALNTCNANFHQVGSSCVADSRACSIANGSGSQTWDANLSDFGACQVVSCITDFHQASNACVADTYTPSFSAYAANTVTAVCSGAQTASRSITACTRDYDSAAMALSRCSDPSPTTSYQSPSGNQSCSIANGTGSQSCSIGSTSWSSCSVVSCATNFHQSGGTCVSDTYTATFTAYDANTVTNACSGVQIASRAIASCIRDHDGAAMASSFCSDPTPTVSYQSPAGVQSCAIANGSGSQSCSAGSTSWGSCSVASCTSGFHQSGNSCALDTFTATLSAYAANTVTAVCAGSQTASRSITACTRDYDSALVANSNCSDPSPTTSYQSPAGSQSCSVSNGSGTQSCAAGSSTPSACVATSCDSLFHVAGGVCAGDTFTAAYSAYSPASLAVCGGTATGTRTISSCIDDQTSQSVATAKCSDPSPTLAISSPAGSQSCSIANGTGTQSCAAGSSIPSACAVVSCNTNFYAAANNQSCVAEPAISPASWAMNANIAKQFAVSGGTAPFTWSSSAGSVSAAGLFTPANTSTTQTVTVTDAAGHASSASVVVTAMWNLTLTQPSIGAISGAASGPIAQGTLITLAYAGANTSGNWTGECTTALSSSCSFTMTAAKTVGASPSCVQYFHVSGSSCVADTFTATYSAYSPASLAVCGGTATGNRTITGCTDTNTAQSAPIAKCSDPSPTTSLSSPAGWVYNNCGISAAASTQMYCNAGQTTATTPSGCIVSSCMGGYKGWASNAYGNTQCVPASFSITSDYDAGGSGVAFNLNHARSGGGYVYGASVTYQASDGYGGVYWAHWDDGYGGARYFGAAGPQVWVSPKLACAGAINGNLFYITIPYALIYDDWSNPIQAYQSGNYYGDACAGGGE
jgi:hypothetical protein